MTPQEIQEARLRVGSFNEFNGELVADSLNAHRDLWRGYVFTRSPGDLLDLRDIADGDLNADTLFLIPALNKNAELENLAHRWHAQEIAWLDKEWASRLLGTSEDIPVLRVWWD